jgi:alginate O-acetyltransferase complex protein AlgI
MLFNSIQFLIFFIVVLIGYFSIPKKYTWIWLLFSSYYFYMSWNVKYAVLMFMSTVITYLSGLLMSKSNKKMKKLWLVLSLTSNFAILFFFKYFNFFVDSLTKLASELGILIHIPLSPYLLPVGISFYTFQALSYSIDVYRQDIGSEKHFGIYALYVSFFPQLVAGPIEKSINLLPQLKNKHTFESNRVKESLLQIGWGLFKKIVIADRIAIIVNTIYDNPTNFDGLSLIIATILFAFQIYCDFSGYSDIAIGCAKIMGYNLMENFKSPYFSKTITEFWRSWHISLSSWFKEYLYIPLGGNRVSISRIYVNILIVFLLSGLWHGANWTFIVWGGLHAIYQIVGNLTRKTRLSIYAILKINANNLVYKIFQRFFIFSIVCFAWIFFRAESVSQALYIIKNLSIYSSQNSFAMFINSCGLNISEFIIACVFISLLLFVEGFAKKSNFYAWILRRKLAIRWGIYYLLIFSLIIFGAYGGFNETQFIYFQF